MATAPKAIYALFDSVKARVPQAVLSGIVGDVRHSFGYHLARNELPASDYSVELALDKEGDAGSASALDISLNPALMKTVTGRLLAAAKARDPRLKALREFCGTLNGTQTYPWDLSTNSSEGVNSWDDSHLWHVHLSFYRAYANNTAALAPIADVIAGIEGDDMPLTDADVKKIGDSIIERLFLGSDGKPHQVNTLIGAHVSPVVALISALGTRVATAQADLATVKTEVAALKSGAVTVAPTDVPVTGTLKIGG